MAITVHLIAAARPNFMKVAPLWHVMSGNTDWNPVIVHTGQHYDAAMSETFFRDLGLPMPAHNLGIGSGSHVDQIAGVMHAYQAILQQSSPDWVVVVGDVNSTLACTLAAKKSGIRVAHLEAGLRSGDRSMPEELNRILTDAAADLLWTPSEDADENLSRENTPADRVQRVGNIMIDSYELLRGPIEAAPGPAALGLRSGEYGVVTMHRPANVDVAAALDHMTRILVRCAGLLPLVFPVHPRTAKGLAAAGLIEKLESAGVLLLPPQSYIDFMALVRAARLVVTDSGGVQEETSYLGIPCLTVRPNTERPLTVTAGTNRLVTLEALPAAVAEVIKAAPPAKPALPLWDGRTAYRVAASLLAAAGLPPR